MSEKKTILVCLRTDEKHRELLKNCAADAEFVWLDEDSAMPADLLRRADAILGNPRGRNGMRPFRKAWPLRTPRGRTGPRWRNT